MPDSSKSSTLFIPIWALAANGLLGLALLLRLYLGPQTIGEAIYMPAVAVAALRGGFGPGCGMAFAVTLADVMLSLFWPPAAPTVRPWTLLASGLVVSIAGGVAQRLLAVRTAEALVANALLRFGRSVGDPTQLAVLERAVVDHAPPLIGCDYAAVFVWNEELRQFDLAVQSTGAEQRGFHYFPAASVSRWQRMLAESGAQPMAAAGLEALPVRDARGRPLLRRALWVPMRRWGRTIGGVLFGATTSAAPFTPWEMRIAEGVAGQVAVAMEGAEAFDALQSRADEIQRLLRLAQELNAHLDLSQLRRRIAEHAAALGRSRIAAVGYWEEGVLRFEECRVDREWRRMPRHEPDAAAHLPLLPGISTGVALIIHGSGGERLGVIELYGRTGEVPFTADDLRLLSGLVNVAAVSLQNARLYERLRRQNMRLRELEQLRDDLTHMIVHDLRTPLAGILTSLQTLEAGVVGVLPAEAATVNRIALDNATDLLGMVNDLLDVSKLESGQMRLERQPLDAAALVTRATRQVERLCHEKRLMLIVTVPPDLPQVHADRDKASRILVNLLGNAIKFTPRGGRIEVTVGEEPASGQVTFAVADTGAGIPSSFHARIFEKFAQVEDASVPVPSGAIRRAFSTGLGLTYCKMATEAHGGRIWVESEPGCGSTFSFTLSAAAPAFPETAAVGAGTPGSISAVP